MDIRIGVIYTPKEIALELDSSVSADAVKAKVEDALSGASSMLWLADTKGRQIGIPADKIAYVEVGSEESARPIGFG